MRPARHDLRPRHALAAAMLAAAAVLAGAQGRSVAAAHRPAAPDVAGTAIVAQTSLHAAFDAAEAYYTQQNQSFDGLDPKTLAGIAGSGSGLRFVDGRTPSAGPKTVSVHVTDDGTAVILAATGSKGGTCWAIAENTGTSMLDGVSTSRPIYIELPKPPAGICDAIEFNRVERVPGSSIDRWGGGPPDPQASLQTALTGAKTWYTQNNQTFDGLNPQTFKTIDTGLRIVDGRTPSKVGTTVSMHVTGQYGSAIILAASGGDPSGCWAILDSTASSDVFDGFTGPGTLYISYPEAAAGGCDAIEFNRVKQLPGSYTSTNGFGSLP